MKSYKSPSDITEIQHLLSNDNFLKAIPEDRVPVIFLDFDGTLSQLTNKPEDAVLFPGMREVIEKCVSRYTVSVVSGRDTDDVKERVGVDGIIYAGSHGFSIKGPGDIRMEHEQASEIDLLLGGIEKSVRRIFSTGPEGVIIARKKYGITVHFRNADPGRTGEINEMVDRAVSDHSGIVKEKGKMIVEIKPDVAWNKGMAVQWILKKLDIWNNERVFPIFVGDDITDEDAFRMLQGKGLGIIVGSHDNKSAADYRLENEYEVREFLNWLSDQLFASQVQR